MMFVRACVALGLFWGAMNLPAGAAAESAWTQDYERAKQQARVTGKPILALLTGSDWCPPCREFDTKVAGEKTFLDYTADKVVLLKLDYPQHMLQAPELMAQNSALAARVGGEEFPRFYLLDAKGAVLVKLNTRVPRRVSSHGEFYIEAIEEALAQVAGARVSG